MLKQAAQQSKKEKIQKLDQFKEQLKQELESAESFKSEHPDRGDLNALIELLLAIREETKAVSDLVEIGDDCPDDWSDLEEAKVDLERTLARVRYQNWIALGPSRSRRINQLFYYQKSQPDSEETTNLFQELTKVGHRILDEDLSPELHGKLEKLVRLFDQGPGKGFFRKLAERVADVEESMDISLLDAPVDGERKCAVCSSELAPGAERCPSCGAVFLTVEQAGIEKEEEAGRSQLLDSLNHSWKLFQLEEINLENFQRILSNLSERISAAVAALETPSAVLLDFSTRLEIFTKLQDRKSVEQHWPSLLKSARALVNERLSKLERE